MIRLQKWLYLSVMVVAIAGYGVSVRADDAKPASDAAPPAASSKEVPPPVAPPVQPQAAEPAPSPTVDVADLLAPGPLPEITMGEASAPVTIVEYHSMTCPHCAHFAKTVLPTLDEKYIKTGKARLLMRSFPLNQLDAVAFMMLRCRPTETYLGNVKLMYDTQETWAYSKDPKAAVTALAQKIGFTQETFESCLKDQKIWDGLLAVAKKADETFKVDGTPSFFINGNRIGSISSVEDLDKAIAPFIKN